MSHDSRVVERDDLEDAVRNLIADVLMVSPDIVHPESALIRDLGAESIDFVDLVFRIEDVVGRKIKASRWEAFIAERLPRENLSCAITMAIVMEFAERERARPG